MVYVAGFHKAVNRLYKNKHCIYTILLIKVLFNNAFCIFVFFYTFMRVSDDGFIKMPKLEALLDNKI